MNKFAQILLAGIALELTGTILLGMSWGEHWSDALVMAGFGLLPLVKLNLVWAFNQGWRVQQMLGRRRPGGLPVWVWAIIALLTALCSAMVATGAAMEASMPHAGSRTMLFGTAALFSIFWATMLWFWWWKEHQQFLGEYELRMQLRQAGWEQLKIDREITQLRIRGWIAVDPNE